MSTEETTPTPKPKKQRMDARARLEAFKAGGIGVPARVARRPNAVRTKGKKGVAKHKVEKLSTELGVASKPDNTAGLKKLREVADQAGPLPTSMLVGGAALPLEPTPHGKAVLAAIERGKHVSEPIVKEKKSLTKSPLVQALEHATALVTLRHMNPPRACALAARRFDVDDEELMAEWLRVNAVGLPQKVASNDDDGGGDENYFDGWEAD